MIEDYKGVKPLSDPDFRDVYYKSKQAKKQFKDKDKYTKFQNGGKMDVRLEYIDFDNESDDIDVYEADKAASKIAKDNSINILRDKNLKTVALDENNNVIGALWTSIIGDEFSFDIAVDKSFQRKGIGEKLLKEAFAEFNAYDDEGNLKYNVDVVNPSMEKLLLKYGFVVSNEIVGHTIMIHPTNNPSIKK
jgi:ribosomal protein S18 acetylase RimI-like enzyme